MPNNYTNLTRPGQVNNAGDAQAIFLEVFSGLVLNRFNIATVAKGKHLVRNITSGKSAQFPLTGASSAYFLTPGNEVTFTGVAHAKRDIAINGLLVASEFIFKLDELMNHFDSMSEVAGQIGQALAEYWDQDILRALIAAGAYTGSAVVTGQPVTSPIINASMATDSAVLASALYDAAEELDEANCPRDNRNIFVKPAQYYLLLENGEFTDRDFGGEGSKASGVVVRGSGISIEMTNNMPTADESGNPDANRPDDIELDFTKMVAVAAHPAAAGSVVLQDVQSEIEYSGRHQGNALISSLAVGTNWLRHDAAVTLQTSA